MNNNLRFVTRTALLLALAIVFQMMGRFLGQINNFVVGPLVNAILLVATSISGIWGGVAISVIAPLVSALTNKAAMAPIVLAFSPFIAAGNAILVLLYYLFRKKSQIAGIVSGAVLKFAFLYASISIFIKALSTPLGIKPQIAKNLVYLFGWPQLITALIGGAVALIIIKVLGKNFELRD